MLRALAFTPRKEHPTGKPLQDAKIKYEQPRQFAQVFACSSEGTET